MINNKLIITASSTGVTLSKSKLGLFRGRQKRRLKCFSKFVSFFLITNISRTLQWISIDTFFALVYSPNCPAERWTVFIEVEAEMGFLFFSIFPDCL